MSTPPVPPTAQPGTADPIPKKPGTGTIVGIVVAAVLLLCCAGGIVGAIVDSDEPEAAPSPSASPSAVVATTQPPSPSASPSPSTVAPSPTPATLRMPAVVNKNAQEAVTLLEQAGFTEVSWGSDNGQMPLLLSNWTVVKQNVPAGRRIRADYPVVLTLHK